MDTRMLYPGTFQHHTFELVLFTTGSPI